MSRPDTDSLEGIETDNPKGIDVKIARVECRVLDVPFTFPLLDEAPHAVVNYVEIETDDGVIGHAISGSASAFGVREMVNREAGPQISGMDPWDTEAVRSKLYWSLGTKYFTGVYSSTLSLIDIALWDIKGKSAGKPVYKLLGGASDRADAYITFGLPQYSVEQLIELANTFIESGHKRLKMLVGNPHDLGTRVEGLATDALVFEDAERVSALRDAVGPDVEIMLDANYNYRCPQALRLAKLLEPCHVTWLEDPVHKGDIDLMSQLRRSSTVPIAGGSQSGDLSFIRKLLEQEAVDYIQPNVKDIGGFTEAMKAAALGQAYNINIEMGGNWHQPNTHLHAAVPNGGRVEFHLQGWTVGQMLFDNHPEPEGLFVHMSDRPGLGYTPKDGIIEEFGVD